MINFASSVILNSCVCPSHFVLVAIQAILGFGFSKAHLKVKEFWIHYDQLHPKAKSVHGSCFVETLWSLVNPSVIKSCQGSCNWYY